MISAEKPKVSIIVPVYNTEKYIAKCVDSLLKQSYDNIEIWLIDDGSTDSSPEICDEFAEKHLFIHTIHKENEGQGIARNVALDLCNGEYIAFVDSDDSVESEYIEKMVSACITYDAQLCVCGAIFDSGLRKTKLCPQPSILNNEELMYRYINTKDITGSPCNKLYHFSLFDSLRFPALKANEDAYLLADVFQRTPRAVVIPEALYIQYIRAGSTERATFTKKKLALLEADMHLADIVNEHFPSMSIDVQYKYARSIAYLLQSIVDANDKAYFELYIELHSSLISVVSALDTVRKKEFAKYVSDPNITYLRLRLRSIKKSIRMICKKILLRIKRM